MFVIAVLTACLPVTAQELTSSHINKVDAQGRRQGYWKVYDGIGELKFEGQFVNGKPVGEFIYYHPNGRKKAIVMNIDSGRIVYSKIFHPNGNPMAVGKYIDQKKDSLWRYFSEEDGTLLSEEIYSEFKKDGVWRTFFHDGKVAEEITYRNDVKEGPWVTYFTTGDVKSTGTYMNDLLEGRFVIYHLNGKIGVSGTYKASKKDDTWVYLDEEGQLEEKEFYRKGTLVRAEGPGKQKLQGEKNSK